MAGGTLILQSDLKFFVTAKYGIFKSNIDAGTEICTFHWTIIGTSAASTTAKQVPKDVSENIAHIGTGEIKAAEAACSATASVFKGCMTKLVILSSLIRVTGQGVLKTVDGTKNLEEVFGDIVKILGE